MAITFASFREAISWDWPINEWGILGKCVPDSSSSVLGNRSIHIQFTTFLGECKRFS